MAKSKISVSKDNSISRITFNRPDSGNAIDLPMADELFDAVSSAASDTSVRCVVLTGSGKLFCAGGDIGAFADDLNGMPEALGKLAGRIHESILLLSNMRKPLLTLVNGSAAGIGMSLAIMGDVALAARSSAFTTAYGAIGLTPDGGMSWTLPRLVGLRRAQEMILTNRRFNASEAGAIGLITRVVDDASLIEEGAKMAESLSRTAIRALGTARLMLANGYLVSLDTQLQTEARTIAEMSRAAECREGVEAFKAKRKPTFS